MRGNTKKPCYIFCKRGFSPCALWIYRGHFPQTLTRTPKNGIWCDYSEHDSLLPDSGVPNRSSCSWKHCSQGHWGTNTTIKLQLKKRVHSHTMVRITKLTRVSDTDLWSAQSWDSKKNSIYRSVFKSDAHRSTRADKMRFFQRVGAFTLIDKGSVLQEDLKVQLQ